MVASSCLQRLLAPLGPLSPHSRSTRSAGCAHTRSARQLTRIPCPSLFPHSRSTRSSAAPLARRAVRKLLTRCPLQVGDRVFGSTPFGGLTAEAILQEDDAYALPEGVDANAAAGFELNYGTVWHGLVDCCNLKEGETLLVRRI